MAMAAVREVELLESWEDMDEAQLERRAEQFLAGRSTCAIRTPVNNPGRPSVSSVLLAEDEPHGMRTLAMTTPSVKILRRPENAGGSAGSGEAAARPRKTLLQRQQDYEAARLRILGQAKCPDDNEDVTTNVQIKVDPMRLQNLNKTREIKNEHPPHVLMNPAIMQPKIISLPPNGISLLRTPRVPDNSRGFNLKR